MDHQEIEKKLTLLDEKLSACTHCGLCSEACITFQSTGWEQESPRGRIHLAEQFLHGRIQPSSAALSTFDRCLGCQACEPLCPHQVPYHEIRQAVQELRRELKFFPPSIMERKEYQKWITLAYRMSNRWWKYFGAKWLKIPSFHFQTKGSFAKKCKRVQIGKPILAICCMQDLFQHDLIEQTLAFIQRLGFFIQVDLLQPCCGAIFERLVHGGTESICYPKEQKKAKNLQDRTHHRFLKWMLPQTYFLSRGCQSFVSKDLQGDLYAWIEKILEEKHLILYLNEPQTVYYQSYCQFQKKGEEDPIWRLFNRIEGLTVRQIAHSKACCGGYGGETLLHPEQAKQWAEEKGAQLPHHATVIVTSSDCWGLFQSRARSRNLKILYPIQLLFQMQSRREA